MGDNGAAHAQPTAQRMPSPLLSAGSLAADSASPSPLPGQKHVCECLGVQVKGALLSTVTPQQPKKLPEIQTEPGFIASVLKRGWGNSQFMKQEIICLLKVFQYRLEYR